MRFQLNLVLVAPEIPQNTGSIGRLCVNMSCRLHLIEPLGFSLEEKMVRRAGLDYWPHLDWSRHEDWESFLAEEDPERLSFASTKAVKDVFEHRFENGEYVVFGGESTGLPDHIHERYATQMYRLPMIGAFHRSLNLANAAAVITYEAYRQLVSLAEGDP